MTITALPNELFWFINTTNYLFPNHIIALWEGGDLVAVHRSVTGGPSDNMLGRFLAQRPLNATSTIAIIPIAMPGLSPTVARYIPLNIPGSSRTFTFGYVPLPWEDISHREVADLKILALTKQEAEVAVQVGYGYSVTQIARNREHSLNATRALVKSALRRTGCNNQRELALLVRSTLSRS